MNDWVEDIVDNISLTNQRVVGKNFPYEYIEYIDTSSVTEGVFENSQLLKAKEAPIRAKRLVKENDIIISTVRPNLKHFGFFNKPKSNSVVSTGFVVITPTKIDAKFLYYFLSSEFVTNYLSLIAENQTSAYPSFNPVLIKKMKIKFPRVIEIQNYIASILSAYDELIEVNYKRIKLLEETALELYKEWFVRMRFPGYKESNFVKGLPADEGEIKYFMDFIKLNRGFDLPDDKIVEGEYPVIASTSVKAYHNQFKVKAPIITTGRSGSLGTVLYVNQNGWPLNTSLYVKEYKGNEPLYVYYTLKNIDFESFNSGAGVPSLNQNHLHKLKLWIAGKDLQLKFKSFVEPIFQQIENLNQQNTQLRQIRDRLLPRLISGKLEI